MVKKTVKGESDATVSSPAPKVSKSATNTPGKESKPAGATSSAVATPASATKTARRQSSKPSKSATEKKASANNKGGRNTVVQFVLAQALAIAITALGHTVVGETTNHELRSLRSKSETLQDIAIQVSWRFVALAVGWVANLDSLDVAAMAFLSYAPTAYLTSTFYLIKPTTVLSTLAVDVLAAAIPFYLLRPLSNVHSKTGKLYNRELINIRSQLYTSAFATAIYSVIIVLSSRFILPRVFVLYFGNLSTVEPAYNATHTTVLPVTLLFGIAASAFLFPSFATTGKTKDDDKVRQFDPVDASLGQTVWWNVWGYTTKTKVLIRRATLAVFATAVGTYLSTTATLSGVDCHGAMAYAAVWSTATLLTSIGLGFVGSE